MAHVVAGWLRETTRVAVGAIAVSSLATALSAQPADLFKDIETTLGSGPGELTIIGSTVFFTADDGTHGRELWSIELAALSPRSRSPSPSPR